ncbi:MAG: tRNA (adenosine(37)-N6)-threonylcarbamoyltransferase complex dimerization subunit type 1 TsaB [Anaerolineales bacterium]|nr:tRNA (adenosine(37)-N6)-threonylcarbamoyltransferase complex dimerization subunit type 1 TsaB [Anaerolineales bacterium]
MILAIDTATQSIGIALHDGSALLAECTWQGGRHHTVELAPEIALVLRRVNRSASDLTAIAVASGPGSYTGLRIGMALAKGLALVHRLPLIGLSTFEIVAQAQPQRKEQMLVVIRAGRTRIGVCSYRWKRSAWQPEEDPRNTTWEELVASLDHPVYVCGEIDGSAHSGSEQHAIITFAPPPDSLRRPAWLAELAWQQVRGGKITDPAALVPNYLDPRGESEL